jgi:hypothetical protein
MIIRGIVVVVATEAGGGVSPTTILTGPAPSLTYGVRPPFRRVGASEIRVRAPVGGTPHTNVKSKGARPLRTPAQSHSRNKS